MVRLFLRTTLSILALAVWSTSVSATLEDKPIDFYVNLASQLSRMESKISQLQQQNVMLEAQVTQLEAETSQQRSLLIALQSENPSSTSAVTLSDAVNRQATSKVPRSCQDLKCMGQNVNGMYSIMGDKSVEMVFCDFSKTATDPSFQQWIGFANVKKNPTYFYVQRRSYFYAVGVPIPYEISKLNIGGALDLPSGKFTAPAKGTYFFSWTGMAAFQPSNTTKIGLGVRLYLNGNQDANKIGSSYVSDTNTGYQISPLTLQSTINLLPGDKVWLQIYTADTQMSLYDSNWWYTHFTGWLLDEDFSA